MRKVTVRTLTLVMAFAFVCSCAFAQLCYADDGVVEFAGVGDMPQAAAAFEADEVGETGTEALEAYIDRAFEQTAAPVMRRASSIIKANAASSANPKAYDQLNDYEKAIYDAIAPYFAQVAAGTLTSTEFPIPLKTLIDKRVLNEKFYAEDLGVSAVLGSDGKPTDGKNSTENALQALSNIVFAGIENVNHALVQDFVYEAYWYDKTRGVNAGYSGYAWARDGGGTYLTVKDYTLTYSFYVTIDCSKTNEIKTCETKDLSAIPAAAENAKKVVADNSTKNDVRKLDAYRTYICDATNYDHDAVSRENVARGYYGDPWQLVRVFDDDPATDVVCEGYSKAFKRLCELTVFNNKSVSCNVTSGMFHSGGGKGEAHMWNTVGINGYNYLVDITNCDSYGGSSGTSGSKLNEDGTLSPGTGLFMRGSSTVAKAADNGVIPSGYKDGYEVVIPDQRAGSYTMEGKTMKYYYEIASSSVLPADSLVLTTWDCPLDDEADAAFGVESEIAAIGEPEEFTEEVRGAIASARADYDALTEAQKSLVSNVGVLVAAEEAKAAADAAAASRVIKDLAWGKTAQQGDDGTYAIADGRAGEVAWVCTEPEYDAFEISVYRSDDTLVGSASADFSQAASEGAGGGGAGGGAGESVRTAYSYYLPQANFTLGSGTYYFVVQPKTSAGGAGDMDVASLPKSPMWTYSAPVATLAAPSGIALKGASVSWTQPASAEANAESLDKFTYWVYRSPVELTSSELARATFDESGLPQASHGGADASFELVIGADYPVTIADGDSAKTCTVDLAKFIRTFATREIITVKEGYYYTTVRSVSDDITTCKSSAPSALAPGIAATTLVPPAA